MQGSGQGVGAGINAHTEDEGEDMEEDMDEDEDEESEDEDDGLEILMNAPQRSVDFRSVLFLFFAGIPGSRGCDG